MLYFCSKTGQVQAYEMEVTVEKYWKFNLRISSKETRSLESYMYDKKVLLCQICIDFNDKYFNIAFYTSKYSTILEDTEYFQRPFTSKFHENSKSNQYFD